MKYTTHSCDACKKEITYRDNEHYPFTGVSLPFYDKARDVIDIKKLYLCHDCLVNLAYRLKDQHCTVS